ncbi:MAG TPA: hypothetical protein VLE54_01965 [Thermoanaerobaculia bacterium]|nr:hypothetical protein [Thermoanaerobaculia bacterium]
MKRLVAALLFALVAGASSGQTRSADPAGGRANVSNVSITLGGRIETRASLSVDSVAVPDACSPS